MILVRYLFEVLLTLSPVGLCIYSHSVKNSLSVRIPILVYDFYFFLILLELTEERAEDDTSNHSLTLSSYDCFENHVCDYRYKYNLFSQQCYVLIYIVSIFANAYSDLNSIVYLPSFIYSK